VTGGHGRLGKELCQHLDCIAPTSREVDILDMPRLEAFLGDRPARAVLHLAAMSDARRAEQHRAESYRVNVLGTRNVACASRRAGLKIFYVSTDYVFPGTGGRYSEEDRPMPANWYGYTKYAGELEVQQACERFCIIRTSFRPRGWGFPTAFTNVHTSADYTDVIAAEIARCISWDLSGTIHFGTPTKTFFELAVRTNPEVRPELCVDDSFPKRRDLNISKWLAEKSARGDSRRSA
jgi:dTDP-4-dehydrorhamnose reductase